MKSMVHTLSGRGVAKALCALTLAVALVGCSNAPAPPAGQSASSAVTDPLPSWNDGLAKQAIIDFVKTTTDKNNTKFVPPEERIATFDQDGTLWVEHPMYTQVEYCLERVPALVKAKPELANLEPFKTVLSGDREAMAKLSKPDLEKNSLRYAHWHDGGRFQRRS